MDETLRIIESLSLVDALRRSIWVYPLVNAGHLLGIALLLGSVAAMDLRVLGFWKDVEFRQLERCLRPLAITGLGIAAGCGGLLFSTSAIDYASMSLMRWKLALFLMAMSNALFFIVQHHRSVAGGQENNSRTLTSLKLSALLSLLLWLLVLFAGRLIAYR